VHRPRGPSRRRVRAASTPIAGVTVGTAGSTPTKPYASVPTGALVLAEASVGTSIANASLAVITNVAALTGARPTPCYFKAARTATFNLGNNVVTVPTIYDGALLSRGTGITFANGLFTVAAAGTYRWDASVQFPTGTTMVAVFAQINGATNLNDGREYRQLIAGHAQVVSAGGPIDLNANDTVGLGLLALDSTLNGVGGLTFALRRVA